MTNFTQPTDGSLYYAVFTRRGEQVTEWYGKKGSANKKLADMGTGHEVRDNHGKVYSSWRSF